MSESADPKALQFLFDVISPYAYLGWRRIGALAQRHARTLVATPVLFAAMLDAHGQKGPAEIGPKRVYTFKHAVRLAAEQGVVLRPPRSHPFNPLLGLRIAGLPGSDDERHAVIDAVFAAIWDGGPGFERPDELARWLSARGLPGDRLVADAQAPEAKARLRDATAQALELGVFGVPTIVVDGELFWGQDSLGHVERFLRGEDAITPEVRATWAEVPIGIVRPGAAPR